MSDLFKNLEHLKLNHHKYMFWRNFIHANFLAVDAYEITIGNKQYPISTISAIRAQQYDFKNVLERGWGLFSACTLTMSSSKLAILTTSVSFGKCQHFPKLRKTPMKLGCLFVMTLTAAFPRKDGKIGAYVVHLSSLQQKLTGTEFAIDNCIFLKHLFGKLRKDLKFQTRIKFMEMQDTRPNIYTVIWRITITKQQ